MKRVHFRIGEIWYCLITILQFSLPTRNTFINMSPCIYIKEGLNEYLLNGGKNLPGILHRGFSGIV